MSFISCQTSVNGNKKGEDAAEKQQTGAMKFSSIAKGPRSNPGFTRIGYSRNLLVLRPIS